MVGFGFDSGCVCVVHPEHLGVVDHGALRVDTMRTV